MLINSQCVVQENNHTSTTEGIFFKNLILLEIAISFLRLFESFGLLEPKPHPQPQEIPIVSVAGV